MTSAKKYTAAIVGLGNIAWKYDGNNKDAGTFPLSHVGAYSRDERIKVISAVSILKNERNEFENTYNVPTYDNLPELFSKHKPDIVSVCTPTNKHFGHVLNCLQNNVPMIWLEKPVSENLNEVQELIKIKEKIGESVILVNYPRRYKRNYRLARKMIVNESLGKLLHAQINYSKGLATNGSHAIDACFFANNDYDLFNLAEMKVKQSKSNPSFTFSMGESVNVFVLGHDVDYQTAEIILVCENGRISLMNGGDRFIVETKRESEEFPGFLVLKENATSPVPKDEDSYMKNALDNLIDSYESGIEPVSSIYTALKTQVIINEFKS